MPTSLFRLLAAASLPAMLAAQTPPTAPAPGRLAPALDARDLESFLDGLVPIELERGDLAGAVISVVKGGKLLLAKGYGYSDVARQTPVSPDSTLFRVASISKLFTATAVMQLVEQGKLDLDRDVDDYLDFTIPRRFPGKITLRNLLTHTAGFEERFKELPHDSGQGVPLRDDVARQIPPQMYRPGTVTSYSNYGADLAGYIVERTSGVPFADYIRLHILEPLGMTHSSIAEPLPPALRAHVSENYELASEAAKPFEVLQGEPSGNMSATAVDMARFAIAHLQLGRYGDQRILGEAATRSMATTQFRTHPLVNGMGLGFFEESRNGHRIIGHGGDLSYFHSHLSLLMDEGVGFFISVNSAGSSGFYGIREAVRDAFLDRYFPRKAPIEPIAGDAAVEAQRVAGPYQLSRRRESGLSRAMSLLLDVSVKANPDHSIEIPLLTGPSRKPIRWYPIGNLVFRTAHGSERVGFVTDSASGRVVRMAYVGGHELHRTALTDDRSFNLKLLLGSLGAFAATLLLWPVAGLIRRRYAQPVPADGVSPRLRGLVRAVCLFNLAFTIGIAGFVQLALDEKIPRDSRMDPLLAAIRVIGVLGALGTAAAIVAGVRSWRDGRSWLARLKYTGVAVASIAFVWFAIHWRLLATNAGY